MGGYILTIVPWNLRPIIMQLDLQFVGKELCSTLAWALAPKMLKICHPCLRMTWSFLQDLSRAVSRFSRGPVAGNHRQHAFDSTGLQSPIGSPSWIKKSADGDFLQLGPWKSVKQLWIDRSSRKLQLILRRGRAISKISEAKAHANVLKGTFSTDCKSNCLRTGQSTY